MSKTYFGYVRVSDPKQLNGVSPEVQKTQIEEYAARRNLVITQWFHEVKTAAKAGRPEFTDMLRRLRKGKADGVIIHKIDRSARNFRDWADVGDLLDAGVEFHFVAESLDLTSRGGRIAADMLAVVSADYIRNLRQEAKKGFYGRLSSGLYPLPAPVGYLNNGKGKAKTIDPVKGPQIRKAFELYATGEYSLNGIKDKIALTNSAGTAVSQTGWSHIFHNPFYYGVIYLKSTKETFVGRHEPLISKQLYDKVQAILAGRTCKKVTKHDFLFKGIFKCSQCNYAAIGERQKGHIYYRCHTKGCKTPSMREEALADQVSQHVALYSLDKLLVEPLAIKIDDHDATHADKHKSQLNSKRLALENVKARTARLTNGYLEGVIEESEFKNRKANYDIEQRELEAEITKISSQSFGEGRHLRTKLELTKTLKSSYFYGNKPHKRQLLKMAYANRAIDGEKVDFQPSYAWNALRKIQDPINCAPTSGVTRTQINKIADEVFDLFLSDAFDEYLADGKNGVLDDQYP